MSAANGGAANGTVPKVSALDGAEPEATDFANYFCAYAYLYHQVCMAAARRIVAPVDSAGSANRLRSGMQWP
jgi:hypothetical protein